MFYTGLAIILAGALVVFIIYCTASDVAADT